MANHEMIQYFRGDGNHPIGVMTAVYSEEKDQVRIGWSKCNKKDSFTKDRGFKIARARATAGSELEIPVSREFTKQVIDPMSGEHLTVVIPNLSSQYECFIRRVVTYFKSVPVESFAICGPEGHFETVIQDTRNADLDRQAAREEVK